MRSASLGRKSSINPVRISAFERGEKSSTNSEPRVSKGKGSIGSDSHIPKPKYRSSSSDRASIRRSNLKPVTGSAKSSANGAYHQLTTPVTPRVSSNRIVAELPSGLRGRSPSAERASGLNVNNGPKKDTRPLNEKNFQMAMLQRIDSFFRDANQLCLLNPTGSLKPISIKIFVSTSNFLLKLLELKVEVDTNNYMDVIMKSSKKIQYLGVVAKSWLKTANTMHSWPHVLGWLSWLIEACEVKDIIHEKALLHCAPFVDAVNDEEINRNQLMTMLKMYKVWNEGDEEKEMGLVDEYAKNIADECGYHEEAEREAEQELNETESKYDAINKSDGEVQDKIDERMLKLKSLTSDLEQQEIYDADMEKCTKDNSMEMEKFHEEIEQLDKLKEEHLEKHQQMIAQIKHQAITAEERDYIIQQCAEKQNFLNQFEPHVLAIESENFKLDIQLAHTNEKLNKKVFAYNRDIFTSVVKGIGDLELPTTFTDPNYNDYINEKLEAIQKLKDVLKQELITHTNELAQEQENQKIREQKRNVLLSQNNENKLLMKNIQLRTQEEEQKLQAKISKLEQDIKAIRISIPTLEVMQNDVTEVQEKLEAIERRKTFLERSSHRFFNRFYELLAADATEMREISEKLKHTP